MGQRLLVFLLNFVFLTACGSTPVSPTQPTVATVTPTLLPISTPSATPTFTTYPPLQTAGPYILFSSDNKNLIVMDADGSGRREIQLPNDGYTFLHNAISPDGRWIIYFTGSVEQPYDIALNILDLSDETTLKITNLLAPDFPAKLETMVQAMTLGDPPVYDKDCFEDLDCRRSLIRREMTRSVFSFDWSPDSQSVAFAAQIEDPSSNVYTYVLQDKTIRRLTDEPGNIHSIDWAPNGQSILYKINAAPGLGFEGSEWHLTNLDGRQIQISKELTSPYFRLDGDSWLAENLYLTLHFSDVDPPFSQFTVLNTDTGQVKEIWSDHAYSYAINKENKTITLIHKNFRTQASTIPEGVYVIDPDGKHRKISDLGYYLLVFQGQKPHPIFIQDYNGQIHTINDGTITAPLPWNSIPWTSPDGQLFLVRDEQKLMLYDSSYQLIKSWTMEDRYFSITWRPDSLGVFVVTAKNVYYLSISSDEPHPLMEICVFQHCDSVRFVWLP